MQHTVADQKVLPPTFRRPDIEPPEDRPRSSRRGQIIRADRLRRIPQRLPPRADLSCLRFPQNVHPHNSAAEADGLLIGVEAKIDSAPVDVSPRIPGHRVAVSIDA